MSTAVIISPLEQIAEEFGKERRPGILLDLVNRYYSAANKPGIDNLDDIKPMHATYALGTIFGFASGNSRDMRRRLVQSRLLSLRLSDYTRKAVDKIVERIFDKMSNPRFTSAYVSLDTPYIEENRKIIAASSNLRDYLSVMGIHHLDDVTANHATSGLGKILGFPRKNAAAMGKMLIGYNVFSRNLSDYSEKIQDEAIRGIIQNISSNKTSWYLALDNPYSDGNKKIIAHSHRMKDYLLSIGINHLDDVDEKKHATWALGSILGFTDGNKTAMKKRLIEYGLYSQNLSDFSPNAQDDIITKILLNISNNRTSSYLGSDNPYLEANRGVIAKSRHMRDYLSLLGVHSLDDVTEKVASDGLTTVLGLKPGNPRQMRSRLVELGLYSQDLREYSTQTRDGIIEKIIDNISTAGFESAYLTRGNSYSESNRRLIARSYQFRWYLSSIGISNPEDIQFKHSRSGGLATKFGFKRDNPDDMGKRLTQLGAFPLHPDIINAGKPAYTRS